MTWADRYARELGRRVERLGGLRPRLELEVIGHLEDAAEGHRERGLSPAEAMPVRPRFSLSAAFA